MVRFAIRVEYSAAACCGSNCALLQARYLFHFLMASPVLQRMAAMGNIERYPG